MLAREETSFPPDYYWRSKNWYQSCVAVVLGRSMDLKEARYILRKAWTIEDGVADSTETYFRRKQKNTRIDYLSQQIFSRLVTICITFAKILIFGGSVSTCYATAECVILMKHGDFQQLEMSRQSVQVAITDRTILTPRLKWYICQQQHRSSKISKADGNATA